MMSRHERARLEQDRHKKGSPLAREMLGVWVIAVGGNRRVVDHERLEVEAPV